MSDPISTPSITLPQGDLGGQYVIQINTQRGFGRWQIFQVTDQEHVIDTTALLPVGDGNPSVSVRICEPAPRAASTATISATEP